MSARFGFPSLAGTTPDAAAALPIGTQIEAHTVLQVLSESRYGFVYLTRDDALGATRVLKEFMPRSRLLRLSDGSVRPCDVSDSIATSVARIAFMNEANTLAAFQHPALVHVLGTIPAHRTLYRVMPLVEGVSLEQHCRSRVEPPTLAWVAGVVDNLLQALQALHERGIAHGCVQSQQVMIRESGQALLLGFASVARELDNAPSTPWQSPAAPQLTRHAPPNPADDFPALAATACFAATGIAPPPQQRSAGAMLDVRAAFSGLPDGSGDTPQRRRGLIQAIESSLARAAETRPQSVAEFRRLLAGDAPLRSVGAEPAPRWVGVVPRRGGDDVDSLLSQPAPLDDGVTPLRPAATATVAAPAVAAAPAAAPLPAAAAIAARASVSDSQAAASTPKPNPAAAIAETPASTAITPAVPVAASTDPPTPSALPERIEPSWPAVDLERTITPTAPPERFDPSRAPDHLPLEFAATATPLPNASLPNTFAEVTSPDTEPFVARLAPRHESRWKSRALAATVLLAAGLGAAWWFTLTPSSEPLALDGPPSLPSPPVTSATVPGPVTTVAPAVPSQPNAIAAPAEIPTVVASTPPADTPAAATTPTVAEAEATVVTEPTTAAAPAIAAAEPAPPAVNEPIRATDAPVRRAAPATANAGEPRSPSAGRTSAATAGTQRSQSAGQRSATANTARSNTAASRTPARSATVAGSAGTKPEVRLRSPLAMCGNRTQFSLVYCLQQQCARTQYRAHPQCIEVRNGG